MGKPVANPTRRAAGRKTRQPSAGPITADAAGVLAAFKGAETPWNPPTEADCARIARTIQIERQSLADRAAMPPPAEPTREGRSRIARAERVRDALAVLLRDLPDLAAHAGRWAGTPDHARLLADLVAAVEPVALVWFGLERGGPKRRFDPRSRKYAHLAATLARHAYAALWSTNPGTRIGLPHKGDTPMARLLANLLALAGHDVTEDAVADHFRRTPRQFFMPIGGAPGG